MDKNNWPKFSDEEIIAVSKVLKSGNVNYWTGQEGLLFEKEFASYVGVNHAVAVSNGTVALELCLRALEIGIGDEVIVTSRTFLSSASAIIMCGASPAFADIDLESQNITADTIQAKLSPKTKAIICVHLAGWPCDMHGVMELAKKNNLYVIEDCAQAHGAAIAGKKTGSWAHISAFSFCQDKIMTTGGEGGMVTTNDADLWRKVWSFKDHGKSFDAVYHKVHPLGFRWLHESIGTNYRLTEMQSAIGRIQLSNLNAWVSARNRNADLYRYFFDQYEFIHIPKPNKNITHAYYKFYIFLKPSYHHIIDRDDLLTKINSLGIRCFVGSCSEVYNEKCFDHYPDCRPAKSLINAHLLFNTSLMFEVDPATSAQTINKNNRLLKPIFDSIANSVLT